MWTLALNSALAAPPAFDDARAYFPLDGNRLAAYDLARGQLLWTADTPVASEPAVGDHLLFIAAAEQLAAISQNDGSTAWRIDFREPLAVRVIWGGGSLVMATTAGFVVARRAQDGREAWRRDVHAPAHAAPTLSGPRLYVPLEDGRVVALDAETGEPVWEKRLGGAPSDVLVLEGRAYVGSRDNFFYCLNADSGEEIWRWQTGADVVGLAAADERRVYFVSLDNVLRALDRRNGAQRWKRLLPLRPVSGPLVVAETVIVTGIATGRAYATRDGAPVGELPAGEQAAPPRLASTPGSLMPTLFLLTRDIAKGATVTAVTRSIEPAIVPLAPLPNLTPALPKP